MSIKNIGIVAIALSTLLTAPAFATEAAKGAEKSTVTNVIPDSAITASIKAKYFADATIKGMEIHVKTINGKVILTGKAPSLEVEEHAIALAKEVEGVKEVVSQLKLK